MMNKEQLQLDKIKHAVALLPHHERVEVALLLQQIQAVLHSASNDTVAAATLTLFGAITWAAKEDAALMASSGGTH